VCAHAAKSQAHTWAGKSEREREERESMSLPSSQLADLLTTRCAEIFSSPSDFEPFVPAPTSTGDGSEGASFTSKCFKENPKGWGGFRETLDHGMPAPFPYFAAMRGGFYLMLSVGSLFFFFASRW
jgi:hypothetical protein